MQAFTFPPPPFWYKLYAPPADGDVPAKPPPKPPLPRQGTFQVFERMFNTVRVAVLAKACADEPLVPTSPNQMIARRPDGSIGEQQHRNSSLQSLTEMSKNMIGDVTARGVHRISGRF
eukprot:scaffold75825_cov21-Tisochrysis_lutea.AAC.1